METKHTPGPWVMMSNGKTKRFQVRGPDDAGPTAYAVASDMRESNARLIAAAPDLLDVAKAILALLEQGQAIDSEHDGTYLRAAITKATDNA